MVHSHHSEIWLCSFGWAERAPWKMLRKAEVHQGESDQSLARNLAAIITHVSFSHNIPCTEEDAYSDTGYSDTV